MISLVGRSNSGKTRLMEQLIPELQRRGLKVAVIKHSSRAYPLDQEGKDTWKHAQAGAQRVVFATPAGFSLFHYEPWDLEQIGALMPEVDLILVEGHRGTKLPKLIIHRPELEEEPPILEDVVAFIGGPIPEEYRELPHFSPDQVGEIADFIDAYRQRD
ncbi:MAG: molybdopterin-guanine dinucleotide biosynthesis protein B [Limnochordia bacterium]|jgi:molybdopterin-guanine dinucleotide biosynthesis protein MobB